jgi:hypothetical protein
MRYIVMHKLDAELEAGGPPAQKIIEDMGALVQESIKSGVFKNGAGLHRSALRARVKCVNADCTVTRGPYEGGNELVAALAMVKAKSIDVVLEHVQKLARSLGDCEIEIGPVVEPWDLGLMPKPEGDLPQNFLLLSKASADDEAGDGNRKKHEAAFRRLAENLGKDGAFVTGETLGPSARGSRLPAASKAKRVWIDGPFAESKELISGFSLLELPTKTEVLAWADRYAAILGDHVEVDVREVHSV